MSEDATPINDGKVNVAGVDINIKQVLGDMIARIRMRMTSDVMDQNTYCGTPLKAIIWEEIEKFIHS